MPIGERIQNAPELLPGLEFYVEAFNLLTPSRRIFEGGIGHIPYSEVSKFCDDMDLDDASREDVFYLISQLDQFYVQWTAKNVKHRREAELSKSRQAGNQRRR